MKTSIAATVAILIACTSVHAEKTVSQLIDDLAVQDQGNNTCNTACGILTRKGDEAVPPLRDALRNENERSRYYAVRCLGQINTKTARSALIDAFSSGMDDVRDHAAYALTWTPEQDAEPVYIAFLDSHDEWHVRNAIKALGEIRSEAAVPHLAQIRDKPKGWYSYYAAFVALRKIDRHEPSPQIRGALDFLRQAKYSRQPDAQRLASSANTIRENVQSLLPDVFDIFLWATKGNESDATPNATTILHDAGHLAFPVIKIGLNDPDENVSRKTKKLVEQFGWNEEMKRNFGVFELWTWGAFVRAWRELKGRIDKNP